MRSKRHSLVNLILWVLPLAGLCSVFLLLQHPIDWGYGWGGLQMLYPAETDARLATYAAMCIAGVASLVIAWRARRLHGFFAGASMLLLVGVLLLWIRSHFRTDHVNFLIAPETHATRGYFISDSGGVAIGIGNAESIKSYPGTLLIGEGPPTGNYPARQAVSTSIGPLGRFGFALMSGEDPDGAHEVSGKLVASPYWFLEIVAAILPALWLRRRIRGRRHAGSASADGTWA